MTLSPHLSDTRRAGGSGWLQKRGNPHDRSSLVINPDYAELLRRSGLNSAGDFLRLREEVLSGHTDRQVSRVTLADGVTAYLKREHRVPLKERLRNWWEGFGFSSKSWREMLTLRHIRPFFDGCPDWLAAAELDDGRAFLLLAEVPNAVPLPRALERMGRQELARQVGRALARLHACGFVHGDLYANHVLIDPETGHVSFLDWQRATQTSGRGWRDLATLSATLSPDIASCGNRLVCLEAYLHEAGDTGLSLRRAWEVIEREAWRLRGHRHIRAKARPMHVVAKQRLFNLDGESLQVTMAFRELWPESIPDCLNENHEGRHPVALPDGGTALLVRTNRRFVSPRKSSPERLRMNLLNRLERFGLEAPRVLAVGDRTLTDGRVVSFLLTRIGDSVPLREWLETHPTESVRSNVLREVGVILARLHEAGCFFRGDLSDLGVVMEGTRPVVVLTEGEGLVIQRRLQVWRRQCDLGRFAWLPREDRQLVHQSYRRSRAAGEVGA